MSSHNSDKQPTKAEIGFEAFPCGPCAMEAHRVLASLEGITQILFDPGVRRVTVFFDPEKVDMPRILSTLDPFSPNPRVISVVIPFKEMS